jgi:stalled ribosome rescue protein Dom34
MSSHYHAVIWIDHREARVFHFNIAEVDRVVLHPHDPIRHIHHKANTIGSGHAPEDHEFLARVAEAVSDAGAILVTGPAAAKTELVKHIEKHVPALHAKIVGVETVDHPTDGELVDHARKYFAADHQVPPRAR